MATQLSHPTNLDLEVQQQKTTTIEEELFHRVVIVISCAIEKNKNAKKSAAVEHHYLFFCNAHWIVLLVWFLLFAFPTQEWRTRVAVGNNHLPRWRINATHWSDSCLFIYPFTWIRPIDGLELIRFCCCCCCTSLILLLPTLARLGGVICNHSSKWAIIVIKCPIYGFIIRQILILHCISMAFLVGWSNGLNAHKFQLEGDIKSTD